MSEDLAPKRRAPGLGRGLSALLGDAGTTQEPANDGIREVSIADIFSDPDQPRKHFDEDALDELAASIRKHGILQPIVVRPTGGGGYRIVAGERRWRAAQRAGLERIPVIIKQVDDKTALELAIVENVQRADLNAIEEAAGYQQLVDQYQYSQNDLAAVIGKSRSHVANTLRLMRLPESVRGFIIDGSLSAGHARALITANDPEGLARRIISEGLSVRDIERLSQSPSHQSSAPKAKAEKDADLKALEASLSDLTGLKVTVDHGARGGTVTIAYKTLEQLDAVAAMLRG